MLRLAIIGDLHYPYLDTEDQHLLNMRERFFKGFLERFMEVDADLHISLGDLTHNGFEQELTDVYRWLAPYQKPFRHVLGNHDAYSNPKQAVLATTGQKRYDSIDSPEAKLLFLDTAREMDLENWGGVLDELKLAWGEASLRDSHDKTFLFFAHHPVYNTTARSDMDKLSIDPALDVSALFGEHGGRKGLYFNGHNHAHSIVRKGDWFYIQTASCLDHPSFRLVEIGPDFIRTKVVPITDTELLAAARRIHRELYSGGITFDVLGQDEDRDRILSFANQEVI
jgi:3',5'-cyclic-AMP phosphodiesterase